VAIFKPRTNSPNSTDVI